MILDTVGRFGDYSALFLEDAFQRISNFLARPEAAQFGTTVDLDGRRLYARILRLTTMERASCRYETHRRYTDLQWITGGAELIDWSPRNALTVAGSFDEANDVQFYADAAPRATLEMVGGYFAVFRRDDAHRPQIVLPPAREVEKIVFKIDNSLLRPQR